MKNRREVFGTLIGTGAVLAAGSAAANPVALDLAGLKRDTDLACLYHCDFGDPARFSQMLQNMLNHYSAYDFDPLKLKLVIVAHGAGIKFFLEDLSGTQWEKETIDPDIYKRFTGLTKYGVEAYLCRITYQRLKIDPAKTRKDAFLKFVPSGVATVGELQAKGFSYLKVG
ncbi:MAG TPA: DsrE family protein [Xanthobacteraceae bacterium]|nr:DsrE family protein [Xanthobacteraceae bacterium]